MSSKPICVLYVEDHEDTRLTIATLLARRGFEVITASSVAAATSIPLDIQFDILVCDIGLPDGSGWDVLSELRVNRNFPAIALTAHTSITEIEQQLALGFDTSLSKPMIGDTLQLVILRLVEEYRKER